MSNILSHQLNANQNNPGDSTTKPTEWLRSKTQVTAGAAKDVEKENTPPLLVGLQAGTTTLEISLEVFWNCRYSIT